MSICNRYMLMIVLTLPTAACSDVQVPEPVLEEVCQANSKSECVARSWAGTATELVLLGSHFQPGFEVDLGDESAPQPGRFRARVGEASLKNPVLEPNWIPGRETLAGVLPGTLQIGLYDVELLTPAGQRSRLPDGFEVTNPLQLLAVPERIRIPSGAEFDLTVCLENLGAVPVAQVQVELNQNGNGNLVLPEAPAPLQIEAETVLTSSLRLIAGQPGETSVLLGARGLANQTIAVGPKEPIEINLTVLQNASLEATAQVIPGQVAAGEAFELILEASCRGETPALDVGFEDAQMSGPGSVDLGPMPSQLVDIPSGSSRTFQWTGVASAPGSISFVLWISGREAVSGRELGPIGTDVIVLEIQ